jgi:asparagine synthase (glutamine-hydrolysing)
LVVALMAAASSEPVRTFCVGFGGDVGGHLDERSIARRVAARHGTLHHETEILPPTTDVLATIAGSFDEPFADPGAIPSDEISRATREHVKVALSGLGGDELFGGYERYLGFRIGHWLQLLPRSVRRGVLVPLVDRMPERSDGVETVNRLKRLLRASAGSDADRYFDYLRISPRVAVGDILASPGDYGQAFAELQQRYLGVFEGAPADDPLDRVFYTDLKIYVPDDILACTDRTSMRHGLEVRVPLLDHELVEFCARIPAAKKVSLFEKKRLLKQVARKHLPREVFTHRKQGFIGPMGHWMRQPAWASALDTILAPARLEAHGLFRPETVRSLVESHRSGAENNQRVLWALMAFQAWFESFARSPASVAE